MEMSTQVNPAEAAYAAAEIPALPLLASATVVAPRCRARLTAPLASRSLNEPVGLALSYFSRTRPGSPVRSSRTSGVPPSPRLTALRTAPAVRPTAT